MEETWFDIPGWKGYYQISNTLKVKSLKRWVINKNGIMQPVPGKLLKLGFDNNGYIFASLSRLGRTEHKRLHRIVAETFIPNPENKHEVNHKNGIKTDNRVENLEWCTHQENSIHAYKTGLNVPPKPKIMRGKAHPSSKSVQQITGGGEIITEFGSICEASRMLGLDRSCISDVCNGLYSHFKGNFFRFAQD